MLREVKHLATSIQWVSHEAWIWFLVTCPTAAPFLYPSHLSKCKPPLQASFTSAESKMVRIGNLGFGIRQTWVAIPKVRGSILHSHLEAKTIKVAIFASLVLLPICLCHRRPGTPSPARFQARNAFTSSTIHIVMFEVFVRLYQEKNDF